MEIEVYRSAKTVLYLGQRSIESEQVLTALAERSDLCVVQVPLMESVSWALRGLPVQLLVVGPELEPNLLAELLGTMNRLRPEVPVVALRPKADEDMLAGAALALSVLARPYPAPIFLRLVDMALEAALPRGRAAVASVMPN
jgi:hypothetical protein